MPLEPTGCPLALSPPDGFTGKSPSTRVFPLLASFPPSPALQPNVLVCDDFVDCERVMKLKEIDVSWFEFRSTVCFVSCLSRRSEACYLLSENEIEIA